MGGRLFALPFGESENFALRGLGLGIAGSYTTQDGTVAQPLLVGLPNARAIDVL